MLEAQSLARAYRATPTGLYLITTCYEGRQNVQFAFRALGISQDPPLLLVGILTNNYSYEAIQRTGELVVNTCSEAHFSAIAKSKGLSGRDGQDKFARMGLTPLPAKHVAPPLIKDSYASAECRVVQHLGEHGGVALILVEALAYYVDEEHPPIARHVGRTLRLGDYLD